LSFLRWKFRDIDRLAAKDLAAELNIDEFISLIASSRGYNEPDLLEEFLSDEAFFSFDYSVMADLVLAAEKIREEIKNETKITIYGDYDCDGITSTALLYKVLKSLGANVDYYIPSRSEEGYGMNKDSVKYLYNKGTRLIITVDNGISAIEEIEYANSLGVTVIVSDHHLPSEILPNAYAVVDPKRKDDVYPFKDLAGVGVAYFLAVAILGVEPEELLEDYGYLACIGTVADICSLTGDNRVFVKAGLKCLNSQNENSVAINMLVQRAGGMPYNISTSNLSFLIAPRINAAGRMDTASVSMELLINKDQFILQETAKKLNELNENRQQTEADIIENAKKSIFKNNLQHDRIIVAASENWHEGVVGIAASKLAEFFGKPVVLLNIKGETASGSSRSVSGFSIFDAINSARDLLIKFGGHTAAAGLTLKTENIDAFRKAINKYAKGFSRPCNEILIDCKLNPQAIDVDFIENLSILEPFGVGNPTPIFALMNMEICKIEALSGGKHTKITARKDGEYYKLLCFSQKFESFPFFVGCKIDVAVTLSVNEWQGNKYPSIVVKDIRLNGIDEDDVLLDLDLLDRYKLGNLTAKDKEKLVPTREECGKIFRAISKNTPKELVFNKCTELNNSKINIIIEALLEIGVLTINEDELLSVSGIKANLEASKILNNLKGGI